MKTIIDNYEFDASAKTVTFTDYTEIELNRVLLIINASMGIVIYKPTGISTKGSAAGNVLSLAFNTTAMQDSDDLVIIYQKSDEEESWIPYTYGELLDVPQMIKDSPGFLGGYYIYNPNSYPVSLKFFDTAGEVILGTTDFVYSYRIPPEQGANIGLGSYGKKFVNGIQIAATKTRDGIEAPDEGLDVNFDYK